VGYRSRDDIIYETLQIAYRGGATKTDLLYKVLLNYGQLEGYLTILTESDLLSYDEEAQRFRLTEKGLAFLEAYSKLDGMLKEHEQI